MALLPPGPYILQAVDVAEKRTSRISGSQLYRVQFELLGTDFREIWAWYSDSRGAEWVWKDMVDSFDELPTIIGRAFLFVVTISTRNGSMLTANNKIGIPLAEAM